MQQQTKSGAGAHRRAGMVRLAAAGSVLALLAPALSTTASAEPRDPWDYERYDCLNDRFNPLDADGNRTGTRPVPGTPEWTAFNDSHVACTDQRDSDRNQHAVPDAPRGAVTYGQDPYRQPEDHDGTRFHFEAFDVTQIPTVPSAEAYRPCTTAATDCPDLPSGLRRFDGPYPVVVVMHGVIADKAQHRFNTQTFAENGYLAVGVDGTGGGYVPGTSAPSSQRCQNAGEVLDWLASDASGAWGDAADLSRVAVVGHSQGGACALGYQGDPRVDTIVAWDISDGIGASNCVGGAPCQPVMIQRTDGGFSTPQAYASDYPAGRNRGQAAYKDSLARDMDFLHLTMRDTVHTDWNGRGTGLSGNRLFEQASNYYNVAWLDLQLKGQLVLDATGRVATSAGRKEGKERAFRQAQATSAFTRLTSKTFLPGTIDKHDISQGFYDPEKAAASGDTLYGGNVPYRVEGSWTLERLSPFYRSYCTLSVPDYVRGSDGRPGSADAARAASGVDGDMRDTGCVRSARGTKGAGKRR